MPKPRVLLADDHSLVLEGFRRILDDQCELVGMVEDGRALLEVAARVHPDIVILDVSMPLLNGIDAATQLKKTHPSIKVIFVTMHADTDYVRSAFEAGASGYLLKRSAVDELEHAIRAVWAGHTYITPLIAKDLLDVLLTRGPGPGRQKTALTFRQREVLQLLAEGRTAKDIALRLKISTRTVEFHKAQLMEHLNLHTTAELIKYALTHGFIASS
ncbi:MAG TPA: response regulator transcription factor [Nitrospira sp.]|jgi:DNA-binding NarL/FixJ family response regulator|nr:response regulator transcription factor [Nitrospira sp.]MCC7473456.1 response regulator transcription factor [Candidatus Nomurabacteria bacterium]MBS0159155.1 response regulator transcription factor [Nitrospira sp.]MBS0163077.1 response regulator transcription factor [Nitrospira sp.]MBS0173291.1 response regulator transcription factor [Nitrospira sp.]